jgi:chromosome segregation ATPase
MGKILNEILDGVKTMKTDVSDLKEGQNRIEADISGLKEEAKTIKTDVSGLKQGQNRMEADVIRLKEGQSRLETQVLENTQILNALEHAAQVSKAEHDNMALSIAEMKGEIKNMRNNINTVELVTSQNWAEITRLKSIK